MSLDQENFEKLESYVEGTLDAEGKAQMQKLLADNPQLQRMMTDLVAQRQMLRNLPRADAPEDLLEGFQGQLEREALLGEPASHPDAPADRAERWPHLVMAAAIVFLVLGLAGLIYEVLPGHRETIPLVFGPGAGVNVGPEADPQLEPTSGPLVPSSGLSSRKIGGFNSFDANKFPSTENDSEKPGAPIAGHDFKADRERLGNLAATSPSDEPVVIVVRSGYPVQAAVQVSQFLSSNNISFETSSAAGLENRPPQQAGEATTAPIALGSIQHSVRQQLAASDIAKRLPVTLPSQVATTQFDDGFLPQQQNGLADRNATLPGQEAASGQITYRAMLTEQQLQRLNAQLLNQPNQWTEVRGEAGGHILSDALPPNAMQNAVVMAKSRESDKSDATTQDTINGPAAPTTAPSPTTTESNFSFATRGGAATSQPIAVGGGIGGGAARDQFSNTQPTTQPTTAASRLRACLIIVNAQPVNFPTPATEAATLPATAPASKPSPTSQS